MPASDSIRCAPEAPRGVLRPLHVPATRHAGHTERFVNSTHDSVQNCEDAITERVVDSTQNFQGHPGHSTRQRDFSEVRGLPPAFPVLSSVLNLLIDRPCKHDTSRRPSRRASKHPSIRCFLTTVIRDHRAILFTTVSDRYFTTTLIRDFTTTFHRSIIVLSYSRDIRYLTLTLHLIPTIITTSYYNTTITPSYSKTTSTEKPFAKLNVMNTSYEAWLKFASC